MKNDLTCGVVRDLLPSYVEGLTAPETNDGGGAPSVGLSRTASGSELSLQAGTSPARRRRSRKSIISKKSGAGGGGGS